MRDGIELEPDAEAALLRGARRCPDGLRDEFFAAMADRLRHRRATFAAVVGTVEDVLVEMLGDAIGRAA